MAEEFRKCLWCRREIEHDRSPLANFCRFNMEGLKADCAEKFKQGYERMPDEYRKAIEDNRKIRIRGFVERKPWADRAAQRRTDNLTFKKCKLGEFKDKEGKPLCNVMELWPPNKVFCNEAHQVRYNNIKKQERRVAKRNDN